MSELTFVVDEIVPERYALSPSLIARISITEQTGATIHAMALRCQVRIEPQRRQYEIGAVGLEDLFGERQRWGSTLKPFLWMHASTMVRGFSGEIAIELPLPCTYDFDVAATKYLHNVKDGEIPLSLMFSGTVFTRGSNGFQVEQIPWHTDSEYRMPAHVWHDTMDFFFPNSGWLRVSREMIEALQQYRSFHGCTSWEEVFGALLVATDAVDSASSETQHAPDGMTL